MISASKKYLLVLVALTGVLSAKAAPVTTPLTDTFSKNPLKNTSVYSSIIIPENMAVTHLPDTEQLSVVLSSAPGANFGLAARFKDLGGSNKSNFTVSTSFTLKDTVYLATWLTALCTDAGYTSGYSAGFQAQTNQLYIYKGSKVGAQTTFNGQQNGDYVMTLKGVYVPTGLELTLTLNDGSCSQSLSWIDTGSVSRAQFFGIAGRCAGTVGVITVNELEVTAQENTAIQ